MFWSNEHDILLCREILVEQPFSFKRGSRERGNCWDMIASRLSQLEKPRFIVDQRAVRDHYLKLEKSFKRKVSNENRSSGIVVEQTELDSLLEEIVERSVAAQEDIVASDNRKSKEKEKEKETAENIRKRSMERLAQTRERESVKNICNKKQKVDQRNTVEYLKEKGDKELMVKTEELELRRREIELKEKESNQNWEMRREELRLRSGEQEARQKRDEEVLSMLRQQLQQQQLILNNIQQQNSILIQLVTKLVEKK